MNIFSSSLQQSTCATARASDTYGCALYNMGISLNVIDERNFAGRLNLTPREIEVCAMHFVDGRPQPVIAEWLGLTIQSVRECVERSLSKQPQLRSLRVSTPRPKIFHLSQLNSRDRERGPFNIDEL
jgi:hypothetical protein